NYGPLKPLVRGNSYTWEVQNLPAIKEEPWMPDVTGLSPYLAVSYYQPTGDRSKLAFSSWQDVSCWADEVMDTRAEDAGLIERKAKELVADSKTDFDRVRAIAHWVQKNIRYVSIQLGVISGYKPNPADVVLKKGYGDCKDKSALVESMLQAVGLRSYSVLVFSGDPTRVRPEFPSPLQFNHAVVAVAVGADSPSAMTHPKLGRLLFFDPTDSVTPLGDFPFYLQGSYGLIVNGSAGELIKLPTHAESDNNLKREIDVQVKETGEVQAKVKEMFTGQLASVARRGLAQSSAASYERELVARVARDIPGAVIGDLKINTDAEPFDPLIVEYTINASSYGSRLGKLLVIKPLLLRAQNYPVFTTQERSYPILFDIKSVKEDLTRITMPEGFRLDELPADTRVKTDFGEFDLTFQVSGQSLVVRRRLAIKQQLMPADQYASVKKFFETAQAASQSSIVLVD
ncbi:MAG TPA: transglutaminase-like domain-containing protein, partial [Blastocatellia bacterium]|nr:transglutaminase-like domain-containing protein [Blastocatellia bacterium]